LYEADELQALDETQKPLRLRALHDFTNWGRPNQHEPRHEDWRLWLILGGRGSGKSRTGAEWVKQRIRYANRPLRVALVGPSLQETRAVMVEGDSGLLSVHEYDDEPPAFLPTKREIVFANGSIAQLFSADSPDSLRGPQFHLAWCDELAKWRYAEEAWNMLQFALRLGDRPQQTVTTTPRPLRLLKSLMQDSQTVLNLGEITRDAHAFNAEIRGLAHHLHQPMGRIYQYGCDASLGDARCSVDLTSPLYRAAATVASAESLQRFTVAGLEAFEEHWFARGRLQWTSGENLGRAVDVRSHRLSGSAIVLELWQAMASSIAEADAFTITAGCDKQFSTCSEKFSNTLNFRGFPHMPGNDFVLSYASRD